MPTLKKKTVKGTKPRAKKSDGTIKVKRARSQTASEHVLDLGHGVVTAADETSIWAMDPYGEDPVPIPPIPPTPLTTRAGSLFDNPLVRETIDDKVGSSGRWSMTMYKRIALIFVVLSFLSLAAVVYVTFVRLDIAVTPLQKNVEATAIFKVYDRPATYQLPAGSALGMVRNMEIEIEKSAPASGKKALGAEVSGIVTIINHYNKAQPLVASTRLLTPNNQILRLKESVVVPAGSQIKAHVYAAQVDPTFALADAHLTIPGLWAGLQDKIFAEVKQGDVTYKDQVQGIVTQTDIDAATALARAALIEKAGTEIDSAYAAYTKKLYKLDESTMTVTPETKIGDEVSDAKVKVSATVVVVAFNEDSIKNITNTSLVAGTPDHASVADTTPATYELISADTKDNVAEVKALSSGMATPLTTVELLDRTKLVSLNRDQLDAYVKSRPNIKSYLVKFTPSFWPLTPQFSNKITVKVVAE